MTKNENEFLASFTNKDGIWFPWTSECVSSSKVATIQAYSQLFRVNPLGTITNQTPQTCRINDVFPAASHTNHDYISQRPRYNRLLPSQILTHTRVHATRVLLAVHRLPSSFLNGFQPVAEQWGLKVCFTADPLHKRSSIRPKTEIMKHKEVKVVAEGGLKQSSAGPLRSPAGVSLETSGGVGDGGTP